MTDAPAEPPAEDPAQTPPPPTAAQIEALERDRRLVNEATTRHLEKVIKPSLMPAPNASDSLPDDDAPSTAHSA